MKESILERSHFHVKVAQGVFLEKTACINMKWFIQMKDHLNAEHAKRHLLVRVPYKAMK